jgi:hypothetical protein
MPDPTLAADMRAHLGLVIPVWFAADLPPAQMTALLHQTLADCELFLEPAHIALVVDGCPPAVAPTRQAAEQFAARAGEPPLVLVKENNEGQGGAVCYGFEHYLQHTTLPYLCSRDADGDHDIYDLPQLYRRLKQMQSEVQTPELTWVLGQRGDLHRPMGFARGQYEALLNELTIRAVSWALGREGRAPDLRGCRRLPGPPDFQSGYKVYTRLTAGLMASALRRAAAADPAARVLRWGIQFISTVELLLAGAAVGSVYRLTYDQQPQTTFENADNHLVAYGQQFVWLYRRLQVPPEVGLPWWDEAMLESLWATVPGGWEELLAIRELLGREVWPGHIMPPPPPRQVFF